MRDASSGPVIVVVGISSSCPRKQKPTNGRKLPFGPRTRDASSRVPWLRRWVVAMKRNNKKNVRGASYDVVD